MTNCFAVVGGDSRQRYIAKYLARLGHVVQTYAVPNLPDTAESLKAALQDARYIILPIPALDRDGLIHGTDLSPAQFAQSVGIGCTVFAGKPGDAKQVFSPTARVVDYAAWEPLTILNAVPTAEGAIQLAMEHMPATIWGSRILIVGAGRIGMCLALKLQALGARVTVTARKARDLARICALGLTADTTKQYEFGLGHYDCIINTVPATVFTTQQLARTDKECVLIELASAPGGFPEQAEHSIVSGAALPGRVAPKTAGNLIAEEILRFIQNG